MIKDYYRLGETRSGTNYYYTGDHLGSVRELTDGSANVQAQYCYTLFGQAIKTQGALDCDFQYAGYFYEPTSDFNLTLHRAYSSSVGRWISRDSIEEKGGQNLFTYVLNNPVSFIDDLGLKGKLSICSCKHGTTFGFRTGSHSWIEYTRDGGPTVTFGTWNGAGLTQNREVGRSADQTRSQEISDADEAVLQGLLDNYATKGPKAWHVYHPCSSFAADAWNTTTGEHLSAGIPSTPAHLSDSISNANGTPQFGPPSFNIGEND